MKTDREIQNDIEEELRWVPDVDDSDITVKVTGGIATLTGVVPNYYDRYQAECAAKRIRGCAGIANDLKVHRPAASTTKDTEIARGAVDAIQADMPDLAADVQVIVRDGHVALEGAVDWQWQRQRLESNVRRVKGVDIVSNLISIRARPMPDDIVRRIEAAFRRNAEVDAERISVATHDGEVTLHGEVRSLREKDEAQRTAWSAPGVTRVINQITVGP